MPCAVGSVRLGVPSHAVPVPVSERRQQTLSQASLRREVGARMALTPCLGLWGPGPPWELPGQGWAEPCGVEAGLRASRELGEAASCPSVIPGAKVSSSRGDMQGGPCGPGDGGRLGLVCPASSCMAG